MPPKDHEKLASIAQAHTLPFVIGLEAGKSTAAQFHAHGVNPETSTAARRMALFSAKQKFLAHWTEQDQSAAIVGVSVGIQDANERKVV